MSKTIIIADDSLTIQKVVSITLASHSYNLVACHSEQELSDQLESHGCDLLLLDFNLSDQLSGYQLGSQLKEKYPTLTVLAMMGTFDVIDDNQLMASGINDTIVKPFESSRFIDKCQALLENAEHNNVEEIIEDDSELGLDDPKTEALAPVENEESLLDDEPAVDESASNGGDEPWPEEGLDGDSEGEGDAPEVGDHWTMDSPEPVQQDEPEPSHNPEDDFNDYSEEAEVSEDDLSKELRGWGMEVPGIIEGDDSSDNSIMPPVLIRDEDDAMEPTLSGYDAGPVLQEIGTSNETEDQDPLLPSGEDEEFPSLDQTSGSTLSLDDLPSPTSQLVPLNQLSGGEEEEDDDATQPTIDLSQIKEESDALESDISSDMEGDDLWEVDSDDGAGDGYPQEIATAPLSPIEENRLNENDVIDEAEEEWSPDPAPLLTDDPVAGENSEPVMVASEAPSNIDHESLVESLKESILPALEEMIKKYCSENVEKVAWEVIPDLAENLITKEIEKISKEAENMAAEEQS